jgi:hypothetical protein
VKIAASERREDAKSPRIEPVAIFFEIVVAGAQIGTWRFYRKAAASNSFERHRRNDASDRIDNERGKRRSFDSRRRSGLSGRALFASSTHVGSARCR